VVPFEQIMELLLCDAVLIKWLCEGGGEKREEGEGGKVRGRREGGGRLREGGTEGGTKGRERGWDREREGEREGGIEGGI